MLLFSAADEAEIEKWRAQFGGCTLPKGDLRPTPNLANAIGRLPRLAALFVQAKLRAGGWLGPVCLEPGEVAEVESANKIPRHELMSLLLGVGAALAQGLVPNDPANTAAVVESNAGGLYVGAQVAWKGQGAKFSVHSVPAAVINAWHHGETQVRRIMVEAPPCVCCRQFLRETWQWNGIRLLEALAGVAMKNGSPQELPLSLEGVKLNGIKGRLLGESKRAIGLGASAGGGEMIGIATEGAAYSYAPYSKNYAGIVLRTRRGTLHRGRYMEMAATMAGIIAVEAAFADLVLSGGLLVDVDDILLVETRGTVTQFSATHRLAMAMGNIPFRFVMAT